MPITLLLASKFLVDALPLSYVSEINLGKILSFVISILDMKMVVKTIFTKLFSET